VAGGAAACASIMRPVRLKDCRRGDSPRSRFGLPGTLLRRIVTRSVSEGISSGGGRFTMALFRAPGPIEELPLRRFRSLTLRVAGDIASSHRNPTRKRGDCSWWVPLPLVHPLCARLIEELPLWRFPSLTLRVTGDIASSQRNPTRKRGDCSWRVALPLVHPLCARSHCMVAAAALPLAHASGYLGGQRKRAEAALVCHFRPSVIPERPERCLHIAPALSQAAPS
jgi:hypothetical protein